MVAPTPTSALLHSSTMVKAGVFLLVKLSPIMLVCAPPSIMVMLVGGITFALCSFMAISQSNAKRVLAYSTIANLGLITACAGVGTPEAVWAAVFLVIFHAVAKSLLFLCVGTAEHHIGSRNIEDMDGMFSRMPHLTRLMMLGIMGMFVAPFGMLVAKWATLVSFVDTNQVALLIILAFGSAATFMFWAKWLGKLAGIASSRENVELNVHRSEWFALTVMAVLLVACCVLIPVVSSFLVEPYIVSVFGTVGQGVSSDNLWIGSICVIIVVVVLFAGLGKQRGRKVGVYLAGVGRDNENRMFQNSMSGTTEATARNWYMVDVFGEARRTCRRLVQHHHHGCGFRVRDRRHADGFLAGEWINDDFAFRCSEPSRSPSWDLRSDVFSRVSIESSRHACRDAWGLRCSSPTTMCASCSAKERVSVNSSEFAYVALRAALRAFGGGNFFFSGGNLLLCVFVITLSSLFFIIAAYSSRSPYAEIGAARETLQVMAYEPMVLLFAVAFFMALGSFDVSAVLSAPVPVIASIWLAFLGLLFILTIKLRKSPFDLSMSHHAHQEIVRGMTTEMSGPTLGMVEIMHWCENVLFLGWVGVFFVWGNPLSIVLAVAVAFIVYLLEIWIDNNFARVKWQFMLKSAWAVALIGGGVNIAVLAFI